MELLVFAASIVIFLFGFVVLFGAPYVPTLRPQITIALDFLDLKPGETMLELGSGDGRVLKAAAQRGWRAVGYELNPLLVIFSKVYTYKYRHLVTVKWGNALTADWPPAQGIYIFGLQKIMPKLHTKIMQYPHKPVRLVSFSFTVLHKAPVQEKNGVQVYQY